MYGLILGDLKQNNEFLWFKISLRLSKALLESGSEADVRQLQTMITEMKQTCKLPGVGVSNEAYEAYDTTKTNLMGLLLEVFAIEIQMHAKRNDRRKTRDVYKLSERFETVMDDPRVKGILKESGGKMYMSERQWELAKNDFQDSFVNFATCGDQNASTILKYVVLAEILS